MLVLSSPVSAELPLPADILRDYTLEFEIKIKRALVDLREPVKDKDCCREITDTLKEEIEEMSSAQQSELAAFRAELDRRGLTPPSTEAEYVHLRSRVMGLEDDLTAFTRRFATLDHIWDEERVALEVGRMEACSRADGLALELVEARSYIHSTLSMEYG